MSTALALAPQPLLLNGARGELHACYYAATAPAHVAGDILLLPSFGEEMNRCRAMVALQARALAAIGMGCLVLDPYGTGDSGGEFSDASWEGWLDDMHIGLAWLRQHGQGCVSLWGIRLGAVMATQLARRDGQIRQLLLWQPVQGGKQFYTQFLRIRIAAELNLPDRVKTTAELRQRSARGEDIEVSGYKVGPLLAGQLDALQWDENALAALAQADWFEVLPDAQTSLAPASVQAAERLASQGARLSQTGVVGPAFWHVHEREIAPDLVRATTERLSGWTGAPSAKGPDTDAPALNVAAGHGAERALVFACADDQLYGVLHAGAAEATLGVVVVVAGGPQYRAGAHRQFVNLGRHLARDGYPVLRFDLRGMGDSSGTHQGFEQSDADIRAAVDALLQQRPGLREVVLVGECESASGILFYAWRDPRVSDAVLINPWVRTVEGRAQVIIRHYYLHRLLSAEFWQLVFSGGYRVGESLRSMVEVARDYVRGRRQMARSRAAPELHDLSSLPLPERTAEGLRRFKGRALLLMSGLDLIAREFDEVTRASRAWDGLLDGQGITRIDIDDADHTFSREVWKTAAAVAVADWLRRR